MGKGMCSRIRARNQGWTFSDAIVDVIVPRVYLVYSKTERTMNKLKGSLTHIARRFSAGGPPATPRIRCVWFFGVVALCGCTVKTDADRTEALSSRELIAMGTYITLSAAGGGAREALADAEEKIIELEKRLSVTDEDSEISRVNRGGGAPVPISRETAAVLRFAVDAAERTEGAFDPTVYPLVEAWGFTSHEYRIPSIEEIERLLKKTGYAKITLDAETATLPDGVQVDLGGVAKGYAGDAAAALLKRRGVNSAVLNIGGNVQTVGKRHGGGKWRIGVRDPNDEHRLIGIIETEDKAVVTSGGYERRFLGEDGVVYHHILDPRTGRPAESGLASVTIVAESGAYADALSTALFVMGVEKAEAYWRRRGHGVDGWPDTAGDPFAAPFDALLVTRDGDLFITEGISGDFSADERFHGNITVLKTNAGEGAELQRLHD